MAKQESIKGIKEGYSGKGSWKENVKNPEGGQINENIAGFRERKDAMHRQDGREK